MGTVSVNVQAQVFVDEEVDVELRELVEDLTDDQAQELRELLERRLALAGNGRGDLLEAAYLAMRGRADCPDVLREYFWKVLGRVL